jgi:predicted permease
MRLAFRSLLRTPGFTFIALLTLALGIGVNTSMVSVLEALLFRDAPFPDAGRLVELRAVTRTGDTPVFSATEIRDLRAQSSAFAALTTVGFAQFSLAEPGQPAQRISGVNVSEDFLATFGFQPLVGRAFAREEFLPGRNQVVLLSHAFWQERFGGAADAIGRTLRLDGENVTIVGVMPPRFDYQRLWGRTAFWRPLNFTPDQLQWRDYRAFFLMGRLQPNASLAQTGAELAPLAANLEKLHPESYSALRYRAVPLQDTLVGAIGRRVSWLLLALSGFVLLIGCANLAHLQLARATAGLRDLAIRAALGASRARLLRQQLTESVVLAMGGGVLGLLLALALNRVLEADGLTEGTPIILNLPILTVTLVVSVVSGVVFGLVPAWLSARSDVNTVLKQQNRGTTGSRSQHRLRQTLIVAEVALALVLLGGAAILQRGFARLLDRPAGWDVNQVLTAGLPVPETRIPTDAQRIELYRRLERKLVTLPGVEHAALATSLPVFSYNGDRQVLTEGQSPGDAGHMPAAFHVMVSADYFATMGIPLLEGRLFAPELKADDPRQIVVNASLARRLWPGRSAVGQRLGSMDSGQAYWAEVVGVVRDVDTAASVADPLTPFQVYKPLVHEPWSGVQIVLRGPVPASLAEPLRRAVAEVDPDLAVDGIGTVPQLLGWQQRHLRIAGKILTGFAALGLGLAAIGLYGVIANLVAQRTGEFGVRLALGARPRDVLTLVLGHGLKLAALGIAIGLGGTWILARALGAVLPRVATADPLALLTVAVVLFAAAGLACWIPARRATKVDPMVALRAE